MQNAPAASAAFKTNPTVSAIFAAYLADRQSEFAYRKCKHPRALKISLAIPEKLWGEMAIEDFRRGSKARVKAAVQDWLAGGLKLATCRKRVTIMRAAFRFAVSEELIERGQEPVFELPPNSPPRERFVDPKDELKRLLVEADSVRTPHHIRTAFYVLLISGVRRGALLDLQWQHVDFENRVIRFRDTEAPEDRSKKRRVDQPMNDFLFTLLDNTRERSTCDYVIEWNGKRCKTIYPALKRMFKRAGMPDLRIHDLRRSSATYVYRELGDLSKAANHIGDTEKMAEQVYVQKTAAQNLAGIDASTATIERARAAV